MDAGAFTDAGTEEAGGGALEAGGCGADDGAAGGGAGLGPPMFREIVGGGGGASVGVGRSMGAGGGWAGSDACWGTRKPCPGTKVKAFALSLLMSRATDTD